MFLDKGLQFVSPFIGICVVDDVPDHNGSNSSDVLDCSGIEVIQVPEIDLWYELQMQTMVRALNLPNRNEPY